MKVESEPDAYYLELAGTMWCYDETSGIEVDARLARVVAHIIEQAVQENADIIRNGL